MANKHERRVMSMAITDKNEFQKQLSQFENEMGMPLARGLQKGNPPQRGMPPGGLPQGGAPPRGGMPRGGMPPSGLPSGGHPQGGSLPQGGKVAKGMVPKKRRQLQEVDEKERPFSGSASAALASGSQSMYEGGPVLVAAGSHSMYEGLGSDMPKKTSPRPSLLMTSKKGTEKHSAHCSPFLASQSTYDLSSIKSDMSDMGVQKLSMWRVRPSPSAGLGGSSLAEEGNSNVSHLLEKGVAGVPALPPLEVRDHPMEWCKRSGKEEDFAFTFMGQHDLKFKDFPQLNKALEARKAEKLPQGERVDPSSVSIQGDKRTGEPYVRSGKVNTLFLMLVDSQSRKASPFSSLEMTFLFCFPLFADYDTVLSMFCSVLQQHQGGSEKELRPIIDAIHHWASLTPEDFIDPAPGRRSYGGGKEVLKKANVILSLCSSPPMIPVSYTDRNYRFIKEFRKFQSPPAPLLPGNLKKGMDSLSLLNIDPIEIARQLTVHSFSIFECINPREWLTPGSPGKCEDGRIASGIGEMSEEFNKVSNFLSESILASADVEVRAEVVSRCVALADELLQMKNFHSFMAVMCSLNSAPILRLQKTWKAFRKGFKEANARYGELCQIGEMEGNFSQLRKLSTRKSDAPMIPYLGLSLSDITFILDGNKHSPVPLDHVNFEMLSMIGKVVIQIRTSQLIPYNYDVVPFVMEYLFDRRNSDQNKLYNTSLKHEPRLSKEDSMKPKNVNQPFRRLSGFFTQGELDTKFKLFEKHNDTDSKILSPTSEPAISVYVPQPEEGEGGGEGGGGEGGGGAAGAAGRGGGGGGAGLTGISSEPASVKGRAPLKELPKGKTPGGS